MYILRNAGVRVLFFDSDCQQVALEAAAELGIVPVWCPNGELAAGLQAPAGCKTFDAVLARRIDVISNGHPGDLIWTCASMDKHEEKGDIALFAAAMPRRVQHQLVDVRLGNDRR